MKISVVVSTKNRSADLRRCLASCVKQTGAVDIIVVDDGSDDGTSEMVAQDFPSVRLISHRQSAGYIVRRNEGAALARGDVIISLDDDAELSTPSISSQVASEMRVSGVDLLALPYIDTKYGPEVLQQGTYPYQSAGAFRGTAYAIRRDMFLRLGGFATELVHQGEERDLTIRLMEVGGRAAFAGTDPILHHESPRRDFGRMDFYGRRNDILFGWWNLPVQELPAYFIHMWLRALIYGLRVRRPVVMLRGALAGTLACFLTSDRRKPVSPTTYAAYRALNR